MAEEIVRTVCGMCHGGCGILAYVSDGRLVKVEGDEGFPINKGAMCPMGLSATKLVYHPDRLKYPMKRVGKRGEGKWERISWDEALDTVVAKIKEIRQKDGPFAVGINRGTGRQHGIPIDRFTHKLGAPTVVPGHVCYIPMLAAGIVTSGKFPAPDLENAACIVNVGSGSSQSRAARSGRVLIQAIKRGAKLISIDPYLTPLAAKSDIWLRVRPHTDCAMALAWLNVIINEGLYDKEFVQKWTSGFDKLAEHVERFTPEWAEPITWAPAQKIRQAARMYATNKPASLHLGVSVEFGINTMNTMRSLLFLPAVTGNIDIPGGNVLWERNVEMDVYFDLSEKIYNQYKGLTDYPILSKVYPSSTGGMGWSRVYTGKPHPIKAILNFGAQSILSDPNGKHDVYRALTEVDFFMVMDLFMTPTAELADIVLPASTTFERDNTDEPVFKNYCPPTFVAIPKVIEPMWECRDDREVFIDILKKLGLDYGADSVQEDNDQICLKAAGITFDELKKRRWISRPQRWRKYEQGLLRKDKQPGFETPTAKIDLDLTGMSDLGVDPLPVHKEPPESPVSNPELAKEYPLVLTTGIRSPVYFHTQYRQIPWLREIHPDPIVRIHPDTARNYGIEQGDWVYIESPRGRCRQKALLTVGIHPSIILAEHDWWFPEKPAPEHGVWQSNINLLTNHEPPHDPVLTSYPSRSLLCKIYKAEV